MKTVEELQAELDAVTNKAHKLEAEAVDKGKQLEKFKGINLDEIGALKDEVTILRRESAKGDPAKIEEVLAREKAELEKRFNSKYSEFESENLTLKQKIQKYEVVTPTMSKAATIFVDTSLDLVNMLVEKDLASVDGEIIVKGPDGKPQASAKDPRKNMSVEEYLEGIANKYPSIAKPKTVGTSRDSGSTKGAENFKGILPTSAELFSMSKEQILALGLSHDQLKQITG